MDEDLGDPFLQYTLLTSDGERPEQGSEGRQGLRRRLRKSGARTKANGSSISSWSRRETPAIRTGGGDQIRYVQLVVTESDSVRGAEVSREVYGPPWSPPVEGQWTTIRRWPMGASGSSQELYEAIDARSRGEVRYFRRERPRLAEMEVRTIGENIALGLAAPPGGGAKDRD